MEGWDYYIVITVCNRVDIDKTYIMNDVGKASRCSIVFDNAVLKVYVAKTNQVYTCKTITGLHRVRHNAYR